MINLFDFEVGGVEVFVWLFRSLVWKVDSDSVSFIVRVFRFIAVLRSRLLVVWCFIGVLFEFERLGILYRVIRI